MEVIMKRYNPSEIEPKWQTIWEDKKSFVAKDFSEKQKFYISCMFPYPSAAGMHTGHAFEHAIVDAIARFQRSHGKNVLNPMGWDTFGLPAENYAIKTGSAPAVVTLENISNFKNQLRRLGVSIDWSREINTSDPEYYRWTQWVFTKFFERDLAYQKESLQWWCPVDKTVLANEQVEGGHCWRCGSLVEKKSMKQWFFRITNYADALLDEMPDLDWPQKIKTAQTNWIGKSQGAEIEFKIDSHDDVITVFSTRPDTLFGASFVVLAPEHPLASQLATDKHKESVDEYIKSAVKKSEIERMNDTREKTGVFTGSYAINPINGEKVPVWIADYVLIGYGTGAVMAVPAHDERDFNFAKKFSLPIVAVIAQDFGDPLPDSKQVEGVVVIGYDPRTKKYMGLKNGNQGWLVGGGREEGETFQEAARRELEEEAGFVEVESWIELGSPIYSNYYNDIKKSNRRSLGYNYLAIIDSSVKVEQKQESHEDFQVQWLGLDELSDDISKTGGGVEHWLEALARAQKAVASHEQQLAHGGESTYHGEGVLVNSGVFNGKSTSDAREEIVAWLGQQGTGRTKTTYKMRDWLISRQRYWGAPIPIIHCPEHGAVAVPEDQLPVILPVVEDYAPKGDGKSALAGVEEWVNTTCPTCGGPGQRETDTMDGYACSSWYLLRYTDPKNNQQAWDPKVVNYWSPVDYYVGGDHAVAHLLYVRFWTHVFNEMGLTDFKEPVKKLIYHGQVIAEDGRKMSKSLGNVIDPLDIIDQGYGADALRTYVLFMGPIDLDSVWDSRGIAGVYRFLNRIWVLTQQYIESDKSFTGNDVAVRRAQHKTTRKVTEDFHRLSFNTAISALMEYTNELYKLKVDGFSDEVWKEALLVLAKLIAPLAPHLSEELNYELGESVSIQDTTWPAWDDSLIIDETITVIVQVNGKLRAKLDVTKGIDEDKVKELALANEHVASFVGNKKPTKIIYIDGRLMNIVL
ncbi:leucine--tRNA ligase [Candidatus Saccharibacteria bacterium]|nr:leucine--tRNA ligase [Candidatus Saccharibacteria bacterium]